MPPGQGEAVAPVIRGIVGRHRQGGRTKEIFHQVGASFPEYRLIRNGLSWGNNDVGGFHHAPDLPLTIFFHEIGADLAADPIGVGSAVPVGVRALANGIPKALSGFAITGNFHKGCGERRRDHGAVAQILGAVFDVGIFLADLIQLRLPKIAVSPHIPGGDVVQTQIEAPVGAEYCGLFVLRLLDP